MIKKIETKAEGWSGSYELKMPTMVERLKYAKEVDLEMIEKTDAKDKIEAIIMLLEVAATHVVSVDLKFEDTEVKSFEEIQIYQEGMAIAMEIGVILMQGLSLGKTSKP